MEPDSVEVVGEGVDAAIQLHEVLVVELPASVEFVSSRPASDLLVQPRVVLSCKGWLIAKPKDLP